MSAQHTKLVWLTLFAIAMANVEAAIVVHLRSLYYPDHPLQVFPLNLMTHRDLAIELIREIATAVMICAVALLSEKTVMRRFAAFVFVFGLWDIFYYAWLRLLIGWPLNWTEWDVLYLVPWPWLGPWIAPVSIALVFTAWGAWIISSAHAYRFSKPGLVLYIAGTGACLLAFLLPGAMLLPGGEEAFHGYTPGAFSWGLFIPGILVMTWALFSITRNSEDS